MSFDTDTKEEEKKSCSYTETDWSQGLTRNIIHQTTAMIGGATDGSVTLASYGECQYNRRSLYNHPSD